MKAHLSGLRAILIVLFVMVQNSIINAQGLSVSCPNPDNFIISCESELPIAANDSISFVALPGALIENAIGDITVSHLDQYSQGNGCPGDTLFITRDYTITDQFTGTQCQVVYKVIKDEMGSSISTDDVTVYLDEDGNAILGLEDLNLDIETECGEALRDTFLDISSFECIDIEDSPITNTVFGIDICDITVSGDFNVFVLDQVPPDVTCSDDIILNLNPCECERIVEFDPPIVDDNCSNIPDITINRTDLTGLNSGDLFPSGITTITYEIIDDSGNTTECSFDIHLIPSDPGSISCRGPQNLSLNEDCEALITAEMMITDPECDFSNYIITVFDPNGVPLPSNLVTGEYLGETLIARATYGCFDDYCEVEFNIEDKMPPTINCEDITIGCAEAAVFPDPVVNDNCGEFEIILLNRTTEDVSCSDPLIDKIVTRTFGVKEIDGEIVNTCEQKLFIRKFDIEDVDPPILNNIVSCDAGFMTDENGNPDPSVTGAPMLDGAPLWPPNNLFCNLGISYTDRELASTPCTRSILREWTVLNWYCGQDGMENFVQSILIVDDEAPTIECPEDITIGTSSMSCSAFYQIPVLNAEDGCQNDFSITVKYPGGFENYFEGIEIELEEGVNNIELTARDICGNASSCIYSVTVVDDEQPVVLCNNDLNFSLNGQGIVIVYPEMFDNGSIDECDLELIEIARMDTKCGIDEDIVFGDQLTLCCEDVGNEVMIRLRVTDSEGNSNECMASVSVSDEISPIILKGLPDITVSNDFPYDPENLSVFGIIEEGDQNPGSIEIDADSVVFSGEASNALINDNCALDTIIEHSQIELDMCGTGTIERKLIFVDLSGNIDSIEQQIEFIVDVPFTEDSIQWPTDITIENECSPNLDPEVLNSKPLFNDIFSSSVASAFTDDTLAYISDGCMTIERQWVVSDWCNRIDGVFASYRNTQIIQLFDLIKPQINSECRDTSICSFIANCGDVPFSISAGGEDNCTNMDSLVWQFNLDLNTDGSTDSSGLGNVFNTILPIGNHEFKWILDDRCGNRDTCTIEIEIESCISPQVICLADEVFYINPVDTSGDQTPDTLGVLLSPEMIDNGSFHSCGKAISLSFSTEENDTLRFFGCDEIGDNPIMLWAIDEDGNMDFCNVFVEIQDSTTSMQCGLVNLGGSVFGNQYSAVENVQLELFGADIVVNTDQNGLFAFDDMPRGGQYALIPRKWDDPLKGISTSDLVAIQRHILGISPFSVPWVSFAADVNQSGEISAIDLLLIRKLILGKINSLPNDKSWVFIPADYEFINPDKPLEENPEESFFIPSLNRNMDIDFRGIKLGDVNESIFLHPINTSTRNTETLYYGLDKNSQNLIHFYASRDMNISALLTSFKFDQSKFHFDFIQNATHGMSIDYHISEDSKMRMLLYSNDFQPVEKGELLFSLVFDNSIEPIDLFEFNFDEDRSEIVLNGSDERSIKYEYLHNSNSLEVFQNQPNPWLDYTEISINLPQDDFVRLEIRDMTGKLVLSRSYTMNIGLNTIQLSKEDFNQGSGVFLYDIITSNVRVTKKMILLNH